MLLDRKDIGILIGLILGILGIVSYALIVALSSVQALVIGIVLGQLFIFLGYWLREIRTKEKRYRELLEDLLKDYLGPIYGILYNSIVWLAMFRDDRGESEEVKGKVKELSENFEKLFMNNFGVFALSLPRKIISLLLAVRVNLMGVMEKDKRFIDDTMVYMKQIVNGIRKAFGLEYMEKLDKEIPDPLGQFILRNP